MKLSGWGRYPVLDCRLEHLRGREGLPDLIERSPTLIARGNGRSYGDAALNPDLTLSMLAMDRIQAFDKKTGLLTCEAGVLLADILDMFVPRGWFPPVVPDTKFVTVGGMIAADVHDKNHHLDGSFGAHLESFLLMTADGEIRTCNRPKNVALFRATLGGMGLTGVILSASFDSSQSKRPSSWKRRWRRRTSTRRWHCSRRPGTAVQRGVDRLSGAGFKAGTVVVDARQIPGAQRITAAARTRPAPPDNRTSIDRSHQCADGVAQSRLDEGLQRMVLPPRRQIVSHTSHRLRSVLLSPRPIIEVEPYVRTARTRTVSMRTAEGREFDRHPGVARPDILGSVRVVSYRPQAIRPNRRRITIVSDGKLYADARLPDAERRAHTTRCARRDHPPARRTRLSCQGRMLYVGAGAAGLSPLCRL